MNGGLEKHTNEIFRRNQRVSVVLCSAPLGLKEERFGPGAVVRLFMLHEELGVQLYSTVPWQICGDHLVFFQFHQRMNEEKFGAMICVRDEVHKVETLRRTSYGQLEVSALTVLDD